MHKTNVFIIMVSFIKINVKGFRILTYKPLRIIENGKRKNII